jgi:hypothetical protein
MKIKTSELTGTALDWAVAVCEHNVGWEPEGEDRDYYSTDWAQGGPIIERERLLLRPYGLSWECSMGGDNWFKGPTPLIAACRCYCASKLGHEVDVPDELC